MFVNKLFLIVFEDYNEEVILVSGDELYVNFMIVVNIWDVCEKIDMMFLRDVVLVFEIEDVYMIFVFLLYNC